MPLTNSAFCEAVTLLFNNPDQRCGFLRTGACKGSQKLATKARYYSLRQMEFTNTENVLALC
jgi:hypothetical protein